MGLNSVFKLESHSIRVRPEDKWSRASAMLQVAVASSQADSKRSCFRPDTVKERRNSSTRAVKEREKERGGIYGGEMRINHLVWSRVEQKRKKVKCKK